MGREPRSYQRSVALAGVHTNVSINIFAVTMDDVFTNESVVLIKRFIRLKAVSVELKRLLVAVSQQETNRRFIGGFRWDHVSLTGTTICENKHGWLVLSICLLYINWFTPGRVVEVNASATNRCARGS